MRNAILVLAFLVLTVLAIPVILVCALFNLRDAFLAYGRWMMRVGRRILGIDLVVTGLDRLDRGTPCVFMSNHLSFLDGPLLMTVLDRLARVIVKRFVLRIPILGLGMWFSGYVPVDREGAGAGRRSIARAARSIREKRYSFLIYPEGTRSFDGKLQRFRRGGFFLAIESGAPIIPVSVKGTYDLMPRGIRLVRKGPVQITFHEPIPVTGLTVEKIPELMDRVRAAISSAL
ncbi:MAG TPA: lysophospholipid acyltransferase family protein [Candidatus Latescibacteria bacterium]|nr:lysophospholipid acyltransferase family protein [Candidatus Latescibacterota bacterium]